MVKGGSSKINIYHHASPTTIRGIMHEFYSISDLGHMSAQICVAAMAAVVFIVKGLCYKHEG